MPISWNEIRPYSANSPRRFPHSYPTFQHAPKHPPCPSKRLTRPRRGHLFALPTADIRSLSEAEGFNLSVKNPNGGEEIAHRNPVAIMDEITALDAESAEVLRTIRRLL